MRKLAIVALSAFAFSVIAAPSISPAFAAGKWDQVEGKWDQFSGKAKQRWGKLTDDDLLVIKGKRQELVGKIQERYGIVKSEAEKQVEEWEKDL